MSLTAGKSTSGTTKTFVTALVANAGLLIVEVVAFVLLKQRLGRIYSPRTYLPPPDKRASELPKGWWRWLPAIFNSPSTDIIHKNGLDAYMFLRFLKMLIKIFTVFTIVTFLIIVPLDVIGIIPAANPLDRITWSNITADPEDSKRFIGHVIVAYVLTFFVLYVIRDEMLHFIHCRHQFLISKSHSRLAQARTVLITSCPEELANEHDLRLFASFVPGGIEKVWIYRDTTTLNKTFREREKACKKLEAAYSQLLRHTTKVWHLKHVAHKKAKKQKAVDKEKNEDLELIVPPPSQDLMDELLPPGKRPTHRIGFLGLFGPKVDTVRHCREEIVRLNASIKEQREAMGKQKFMGTVFIRCNFQAGAHILAQVLNYHEPLMMDKKWIETSPADIVWSNLDDGAVEVRTRYVISWLLTIGLVIAWGFPVFFVGLLSNVDDLCTKVRWLSWLCRAPSVVIGIITGILPPVFLAILFILLPLILRALAWYECIPRYSSISLSVYRRFFLLLLIHGFLIVTLSSGITKAAAGIISNPTHTVQELAQQLPGASVFFLTYTVTQGLSGAGGALAQLVPLAIYFIRKKLLGRTPRQAYAVTFLMPAADFGIILPQLSLLATIAFAYSILNPLINPISVIAFGMFYLAWKFLFTQVFDQPEHSETGGLYFPMAISNIFVALYIEQITLACLFFLKASISKTSSIIEGSLMIFLIVLTAGTQILIQSSFDPLIHYLPMSLATKKMATRYAKQRAEHTGLVEGEDIDLFSRDHKVRRRLKRIPGIAILDNKIDTLKAKVLRSPRPSVEEQPQTAKSTAAKFDNNLSRVASGVSVKSNTSKKSAGSHHSTETHKTDKSHASSVPPVFDAPAPAGRDIDDEDSDDEVDFNEHAFDHPSLYVEQPWIWIPKDPLGLSEILVNELHDIGVDASDLGAAMDKKGVVEVTRNPPDEAWDGGQDT
ncbi:DUF221 family protein [Mycena floridula]|nr:DUF221 family protein [Mycena floridula]